MMRHGMHAPHHIPVDTIEKPYQDAVPEGSATTSTWLNRGRRWLPLFSFCAGICSYALLERGEATARWIPLLLIIGWVVQPYIAAAQRRTALLQALPPSALESAGNLVLQSVQQESFFFALPFIYRATVWDSPSTLFSLIVGLAGAVSVIDPVWSRWIARHRLLLTLYHALALFVAALVAIPLLAGTDAATGLIAAAALTTLFAVPTLSGWREFRRWRAWGRLLLLAVIGGMLAWVGRGWIPPAPLRVVDAAITPEVIADKLRVGSPKQVWTVADLRGGVVAYTPIRAPLGLNEAIFHEWIHEGERVDRIQLDIRGGRKAGFRTWSRKQNFPANPVGQWLVDVVTAYGQLLGRLRFTVTAQ
ncbi:MAG: DUF2914 domain-containing protein [Candidatus Dadabacteria bacterium]|nr:MAG: DUF2914 domain-containing protein [Candidatus Dadabacteria bacterium]